MHFKFRHLNKIIGLFFIVTCVIVLVLLTMVARGQRWFQTYTHYAACFDHGAGLELGTPVLINGLNSGVVDSVRLENDAKVCTKVKIFRQCAKHIREGSEIRIVQPLFGSSTLEIATGPAANPAIPPKGIIPAAKGMESGLDALLDEAKKLVKKLDDPDGDLAATLRNLNSATKRLDTALASRDSTLGMLVENRELYNQLIAVTNHLSRILSMLEKASPDIRDAITGAYEIVGEANKLIRAVEKSVFIRGHMEKYLKEDSSLRSEGRIE